MKLSTHVFIGLMSVGFLLTITEARTNSVVDISHYNGKVNLEKAKNDGITTVIHKATEGTNYVDKKYNTNKSAAEKAGLTWAAYHFATGSDGVKQAEHFVSTAGKVKRYIIDLEENPRGTTVGKKQAEDMVKTIEKLTGQLPIVYGSPSFLNSLNSQVLRKCPLWLANYRSSPKMPNGWSEWLMWQYTDGTLGPTPHTVEGIGKVDRSFLNAPSL